MKDNFFVVCRSLFKNKLWEEEKPFTKGQAWVDLFGNANYKDGGFTVKGQFVEVKRGQTGRSINTLSDKWGWSRNKVKRFLRRLSDERMIDHKTNHLTSIITICNYEEYQGKEINNEPTNEPSDEPSDEPQTKKDKRKNKEYIYKKPKKTIAPKPEEYEIPDLVYKWAEKNNIPKQAIPIHMESCFNHFRTKGELRSEWHRSIYTWARKDYDKINDTFKNNSKYDEL
jgi:hypothetical protein